MPTDRELLRQYVKDGSEAAFAELVRRYIRLVYSAAVRQAGGNGSLAEDITQTVFIILARQAPRLAGYETLVGWLHTSVRYTTLRSLRDLRRRQAREQKAVAMETNAAPNVPWEEVKPLLDEAVSQLSATDRQAVLLRYFQGRSHREVGEALGQTEDAARVRVDRAVEKLRGYFARRGIVTTGAILGETILAHAAEVEPAGLAGRVNAAAKSALTAATVGWGGLLLRIFLMQTKTKILIVATVVLLASLIALSVPNWAGSSAEDKPVSSSSNKPASTAKKGAVAVEAPRVAAAEVSTSSIATAISTSPADSQALAVPMASLPASPPPPAPPPPAMGGPGGMRRGTGTPPGGDPNRRAYANLFLKLKLNPEQQAELVKILGDKQAQATAAMRAAVSKLGDEKFSQLLSSGALQPKMSDAAVWDQWLFSQTYQKNLQVQLGITDQIKAINDSADAQLRQLLGSPENYQAFQTYTSQSGIRQWVQNAYSNALQSAGATALTTEQQEALVGIVADSLQPGDFGGKLKQLSQVVDQASTVLTADQVDVLKANPGGVGEGTLSYERLHYVQ